MGGRSKDEAVAEFVDATEGVTPTSREPFVCVVCVRPDQIACEVEDGEAWLVDRGMPGTQFFQPLHSKALCRRFAGVRDERTALHFANRYGFLGLSRRASQPTATAHELFQGTVPEAPERLSDWLREADRMRVVLQVWDTIRQADVPRARRAAVGSAGRLTFLPRKLGVGLTKASTDADFASQIPHVFRADEGVQVPGEQLTEDQKRERQKEVLLRYEVYLRETIQQQVSGHLLLRAGGHWTWGLEPDSLLTAMYVSLALDIGEAEDRKPVPREAPRKFTCRYCGKEEDARNRRKLTSRVCNGYACQKRASREKKSKEATK